MKNISNEIETREKELVLPKEATILGRNHGLSAEQIIAEFGDDCTMKIGVNHEWFWVTPFNFKNEMVHAMISNDMCLTEEHGLVWGDKIEFPLSEVRVILPNVKIDQEQEIPVPRGTLQIRDNVVITITE